MAEWPYNTQRWQRLRKAKLARQPLCEDCRACGIVTPANVADHINPVRLGGPAFPPIDGLRSLCASCHGAKTARGPEAGAVQTTRPRLPRKGCTTDGRPLDPMHPWRKAKSLTADDRKDRPPPSQSISFDFPGIG